MSKQVDERVVAMKFDNSNFESNVKTTMSTLEKLKTSLNLKGASKGLEDINSAAKNVSLDGITEVVSLLERHFSTMGIVGATAIQNITTSMMRLTSKAAGFVKNSIISGGISRAMNLENANFQLQGLLKNEKAVAAVMKNVGDSVDGTAYSLDAAAKVASQLAASGMKAGDQMFSALRGVAGVAAMTNSSYEDIGRIYTQVAGQGRLMGDQLLQLSGRGMNAAATLAKHLGKTEGEIRDMVSKGKIDFATFAEAMDSAFGEHAKKANETLTGAFSNVKAALGRIGAEFISPLVVQNGPLVKMLNALRERINDIKANIGPLANLFTNSVNQMAKSATKFLNGLSTDSKWTSFTKKLEKAGISTSKFEKQLKKTAKSHGVSIDAIVKKEGSLAKAFQRGKIDTNLITEALKKFADNAAKSGKKTEDMNKKLKEFQKVVNRVWSGDFKNGEERVKALTKAGYNYAQVQKLVNKTVDGHKLTLKDLSDVQLKAVGYTDKEITAFRKLAAEAEKAGTPINELINSLGEMSTGDKIFATLGNVFTQIKKVIDEIKKAWKEVFPKDGGFNPLGSFVDAIYDLVGTAEITENALTNIGDAFKGIFDAVWLFGTLSSGAVGTITKIVKSIASLFGFADIWGFLGHVGRLISEFKGWVTVNNSLSQSLIELGEKVFGFVDKCINKFLEWIDGFLQLEEVQNAIDNIGDAMSTSFDKIISWLEGFGPIFGKFIEDLKLFDGFSLDNITKAFENLWKGISSQFSGVDDIFDGLGKAIWGFVKEILNYFGIADEAIDKFMSNLTWENFIQALTNFGESVRNFFSNFSLEDNGAGVASDIIDGLKNGLGEKAAQVYEVIADIGAKIIEAIKAVLGIHSPSVEFFEIGKNIIEGLINGIQSILGPLWEFLKGVGQGIVDVFSQLDWGTVLTIIASSGIFFIFYKLVKVFQTFADAATAIASPFKAVGKILNEFAGVINSFQSVVKAEALKVKSEAVKNLAIAIAILAGSILVLSKIDIPTLWNAVGAIGALAVIMGVLAFAINKFASEKVADSVKISGFLLGIGGALLMLAVSMKILSGITWDELKVAVVGLGTFAIVVRSLIAVTHVAGSEAQIDKATLMITKIGAAFLVLGSAMRLISGISDAGILKGIGSMMVFTALIAILIASSNAITDKDITHLSKILLSVGAAFLLFALTAKILGGINVETEAPKAAVGLLAFLGLITLVIAATKFISDKDLSHVSAIMISFGASLMLMAVTCRLIGGMDVGSLVKAVVAIGFLGAIVAGLVFVTRYAGGRDLKGVAVTLLAMSASIAILAGVCVILGLVKEENLDKGISAVEKLALLVTMMVLATKYAKDVQHTMIGIAVAIGVMAGAMVVLSLIDPGKLAGATVALGFVLGMFALVELASGQVTSSFKTIIAIDVAIGLLAAALGVLALLPVEKTIGSALALSMLLLTFAGALRILNGVGTISKKAIMVMGALMGIVAGLAIVLGIMSAFNVTASLDNALAISTLLFVMAGACNILGAIGHVSESAIGAMVVITGLVAGLAVILGVLAALNITPAIETSASLSILLISMSAAVAILAPIGPIAQGAVSAAVSLVEVAGILAIAFAAFGALAQIPGVTWIVEEGGEFLQKIGTAIGRFIGGIAGSVLDGATSTLPTVADQLSDFMTRLTPFLDGIKTIDSSALEACTNLSMMIASLTGSGLMDTISSWLGGGSSLTDFADQLIPFGEAICAFSNTVSGVDVEAINASAEAATALSELASNLPKEGGLAQAIFGEATDLGTFGLQLAQFGMAIKSYSTQVTGIDTEAITASAQTAKALSELSNNLPKEGGLSQAIFGENTDLGTFGTQLSMFGLGIKMYSESVSGLDISAIQDSVKAGEALTKLAESLPESKSGGLAQAIFGEDSDLASFGSELSAFGGALGSYSDSMVNVDFDSITKSTDSVSTFIKASNDAGQINEENIGKLGKIGGIADALVDYDSKVSGVSFSSILKSLVQANSLIEFITGLANLNTSGIENFKKALSDLANTGLDDLAKSFESGAPRVTNALDSMLNSAVSSTNVNAAKFRSIGSEMTAALASGMYKGGSRLKSNASSMVVQCLTEFSSKYKYFNTIGNQMVSTMANGIEAKSSTIKNGFTNAVSSAASGVRVHYGEFVGAGLHLGTGLINGMYVKKTQVYFKGVELGRAAAKGVKDGAKEHSPSKLTFQYGIFLGLGLINGMKKTNKDVYSTGRDMGEAAAMSVSGALSTVASIMDLDMDAQPTIRPVVDLSNVRSSSDAIGNMFSDATVGVFASLNSISSTMNRNNQNGTIDDVVSAVNKLNNSLNNLERPSYNINGITYDDGSNIANAIGDIVRAARTERRV